MRSIKFTASNGSSITFDSSGSEYFITSLEGIDTPTVDSQTQQAPYQDGVTNIDQLFEARDITLEGIIKTPVDLTAINTHRRIMQSVLNPKLGPGTILYTYDSGSKTIQAKCIACTFANRNMPTPFQTFQIQFECADPYWKSTTTDSTSVGLVSALTKFPIAFTRTYIPFIGTGAGGSQWQCITSDPSGNIWAGTNGGDIYKCNVGSTTFHGVGGPSYQWWAIASDPSGNIWACASQYIYKCNAGSTTFTIVSTSGNWYSITSDPSGNIWAGNYGVDIYKCNVGSTTFTGIGAGSYAWQCITSDTSGNIWAGIYNGVIYKCNSGSSSFIATTSNVRDWHSITSDPSGNIWAADYGDVIYTCNQGSTIFVGVDSPILNWTYIASDNNGNVWAIPNASGTDCNIYKYTAIDNRFVKSNPSLAYPWRCVTSDPSGNIWAGVVGVDIYRCAFANTNISGYIFSEISTVSSRTITVNGDVSSSIIATLYGPAVNPTLINETTGEFIHLIYTLNIGESIVINTTFGTKTITLNAGENTTNGLQYLDPASTFFELQVGNNIMNIHDDTGSAQLRCDIGKVDRFVGI